MPFKILKINNKYIVYNKNTNHIYCYANTMIMAQKQIKLLHVITRGKGFIN